MTEPQTSTTDSLPTSRSLLSHLRKGGDDAGWTTFYDTYWRLIFNVARKRGISEPDAQEIVQDVLASLAREMSAVQGASIGEIARTLSMNAAQVYIARHRVGRLVKAELKNIEGKI